MKKIILLGCGGHAKSIVDAIESQGEYEIAGFVDAQNNDFLYRNYKVIGDDKILKEIYSSEITNAFVCVGFMGNGTVRNNLYQNLKNIGYNLPVIIDKTATIATDAQIGEGTFVGKNAVINSASAIGKMAIINTSSVIEHDCSIGDFSHISVGTVLCGNVGVGAESLVGANSTVIQGKQVGNKAIVGAGSLILRNVTDGETVVGIVK